MRSLPAGRSYRCRMTYRARNGTVRSPSYTVIAPDRDEAARIAERLLRADPRRNVGQIDAFELFELATTSQPLAQPQ